jgi:glutamate carboxypeptidase
MPFKLEGNRLSGPGTFDMKGGLTMIIFALEMLHELGQTPTVQPLVLVNSDEEIGSLDSRDTIIALAKEANRAFVLEPGKGERGSLKMVRPGVAHYRMTTRGIPSHAGLSPQSGASAILEMSHVIQKVTALRDWERGILVNAGVVEGGSRPNVVAETCQIEVDVRANTAADAEEIHGALMAVEVEDERVTLIVEGGFNRPPMEMTKGNLAFWTVTKKAGNRLGMALDYGQVGGASDGNFTSQHCPTMDGLGPVGDGAHAYHEHLFLDKVAERTALLALLLLEPPLKR